MKGKPQVRIQTLTCLLIGFSILVTGAVFAQDNDGQLLEEVIVTATKMGEASIQDTPMAITAFTGDQISESVMTDVRDLEGAAPGLTISENTGYAQVYIRGVGSNNVFAGADPSSTIHLDGVYIARPQASFNSFLDVERVEVLRGPQGTLYGRNSVGGTINIISKSPSFSDLDYKYQVALGNEGYRRLEAYASGPFLPDRLAASLAILKTDRDAFQENVVAGGDQLDDDDSLGIKTQLRADISENVEATLRADYYSQTNNIYGFNTLLTPSPAPQANEIFGDFRRVAANSPHDYDRDNWGASLAITGRVSDDWTLKSLTGYRENEFFFTIDSDASDLLILATGLGENQDQLSQEFDLTGQFDGWNLIVGAFYFRENIEGLTGDIGVNVYPSGISRRPEPRVTTSVIGLFAQAAIDITDRATLTLGARYTEEKKDFRKIDGIYLLGTNTRAVDLSFPDDTGRYDDITPKVGLDLKLTDSTMVYASATKGFKSGGFNFTASTPGGYDEEILWAYEAGFKSEFADDRVRLNVSAFYYDYEDLQVQSFLVPGQIDVDNAATAEVSGVEVEFLAMPTTSWQFGLSLASLDAKYDSYPEAAMPGGTTIDASGNKLNNSPEISGQLSIRYEHDLGSGGGLYVRSEYTYKSEVFFTADNNSVERQGDYGLLNVFAGYSMPSGRLSIELFGRNILDEDYITSSANFTIVPSGRVGWPATYGVQFRYSRQPSQ